MRDGRSRLKSDERLVREEVMANKIMCVMDEAELRRSMALLGPPPILTTEDAKAFDETFLQFAKCFKVRDLLMLDLAWHYTANSWFIRRNMRHGTIAIERWYGRNRATEIVQAQIKKAQYEKQLQSKAQQMSRSPTDVAEMAALEKGISNTVADIDRILAHKATEIDHNRAIQLSAEFQENMDQLNNGATRRRNDAFELLERYSAGLGRAVQETFGKVVDAEFEEIENESNADPENKIEDQPAITAAPSITPKDDETLDDIEP